MTIALPTTLLRTREVVEPALREAVDRLDPQSRRLASYHFGWTDADGRPAHDNGGKAVRPAFALLSARAAGATWTLGVPGAVAVELVHNFSLLHDDLMDGDVLDNPAFAQALPGVAAAAFGLALISSLDTLLLMKAFERITHERQDSLGEPLRGIDVGRPLHGTEEHDQPRLGLDGRTLLMTGLVVCGLGFVFGLVIFAQIRALPVHDSMREISLSRPSRGKRYAGIP